jgi:hypothetical protein
MALYGTSKPFALVYPEDSTNCKNILLIDHKVKDAQTFYTSVNASTFPILYKSSSSSTELLALLQSKFTTIDRIGIVFTVSKKPTFKAGISKTLLSIDKTFKEGIDKTLFLDQQPFFSQDGTAQPNTNFITALIKTFSVKNLDYLACNTLTLPAWLNYYSLLMQDTGVIVGASNDETGNLKYGGNWLLESTGQDIELIYFTESIEYYTYLLDEPVILQALKLVWNNDPTVFAIMVLDTANQEPATDSDIIPDYIFSFKLQVQDTFYLHSPFVASAFSGIIFDNNQIPLNYTTSNMLSQFTDINVYATEPTGPTGTAPFTFVLDENSYSLSSINVLNNPPQLQHFRVDYSDGVYLLLTIDVNNYYDFVNFFTEIITDPLPAWLIKLDLYYAGELQYTLPDFLGMFFFSGTNYPFNSPTNLVASIAFVTRDFNVVPALGFNEMFIESLELLVVVSRVQLILNSDICFPGNTPIQTDQGFLPISELEPGKHTIRQKAIAYITQTISPDRYLVCFEKNAFGPNCPSQKTIMTKDHKVFYAGNMHPAKIFVGVFPTITKIKYTGEILYNVLLENHGTMRVNNLLCETLDPANFIAKLYTKYSADAREKICLDLRECIRKKDKKTYKKIIAGGCTPTPPLGGRTR